MFRRESVGHGGRTDVIIALVTPDDFQEQYDRLIYALNEPTWADQLGAWMAVATVVLAIAAIIYAAIQVNEAKKARQQAADLEVERSQPYVVAYMEPSEASKMFIDFVVKNYGLTAARDVVIQIDPAPRRSFDGEEVAIPSTVPILAPGQEWRSSWDNSRDRLDSELPDRHVGTVTFSGIGPSALKSPIVLDWSVYKARRWIEVYGKHDAAKALRDIRSYLKTWSEGPQGGLRIYTRDGDARDKRLAADHDAYFAGKVEEDRKYHADQAEATSEQPVSPASPEDGNAQAEG